MFTNTDVGMPDTENREATGPFLLKNRLKKDAKGFFLPKKPG